MVGARVVLLATLLGPAAASAGGPLVTPDVTFGLSSHQGYALGLGGDVGVWSGRHAVTGYGEHRWLFPPHDARGRGGTSLGVGLSLQHFGSDDGLGYVGVATGWFSRSLERGSPARQDGLAIAVSWGARARFAYSVRAAVRAEYRVVPVGRRDHELLISLQLDPGLLIYALVSLPGRLLK